MSFWEINPHYPLQILINYRCRWLGEGEEEEEEALKVIFDFIVEGRGVKEQYKYI